MKIFQGRTRPYVTAAIRRGRLNSGRDLIDQGKQDLSLLFILIEWPICWGLLQMGRHSLRGRG